MALGTFSILFDSKDYKVDLPVGLEMMHGSGNR